MRTIPTTLERPAGLEPATSALEVLLSNQLSYGRVAGDPDAPEPRPPCFRGDGNGTDYTRSHRATKSGDPFIARDHTHLGYMIRWSCDQIALPL